MMMGLRFFLLLDVSLFFERGVSGGLDMGLDLHVVVVWCSLMPAAEATKKNYIAKAVFAILCKPLR